MTNSGPRRVRSVGPRDNPKRIAHPAGQRTAEDLSAEIEDMMSEASSRDRIFGFGSLLGMLGLAVLVAAPLGWGLNAIGLIPGPTGFERGQSGRELAMMVGRDMVKPVYWLFLTVLAYVLQICRPLVPLLLIGGVVWWSWLGLYMAYEAGLIVMPISPPFSQ